MIEFVDNLFMFIGVTVISVCSVILVGIMALEVFDTIRNEPKEPRL